MPHTPIAPSAPPQAIIAQWLDAICDDLGWSQDRRSAYFADVISP